MAKPKRLKVFRTPIGFHDAYVAAPSQKAALEAWGANTNLFAGGAAEQVTDAELMKAALERPGEVVRVMRGNGADESTGKKYKPSPRPSPASGRGRKPSRSAMDAAEAALAELERAHKAELRELGKEEERLARRRREIERRHEAEHDEAASARDGARASYDRAMRAWKRAC